MKTSDEIKTNRDIAEEIQQATSRCYINHPDYIDAIIRVLNYHYPQALSKALPEEGEWISVEDKLPEHYTDVWIYGHSQDKVELSYTNGIGYWTENFTPKYWMPCIVPSPPKP